MQQCVVCLDHKEIFVKHYICEHTSICDTCSEIWTKSCPVCRERPLVEKIFERKLRFNHPISELRLALNPAILQDPTFRSRELLPPSRPIYPYTEFLCEYIDAIEEIEPAGLVNESLEQLEEKRKKEKKEKKKAKKRQKSQYYETRRMYEIK